MKIETEEAARRLADAIVSDIRLYNADAIAQGRDLSVEIGEGRALFRSRVLPAFHSLFERAFEASGIHAPSTEIGTVVEAETESEGSSTWMLILALAFTALVAWQLLR